MIASVPGGELEKSAPYVELTDRINELTERLRPALAAGDVRTVAELRLERAYAELGCRDLWGPWSSQGGRWNAWMWDDINQARSAAAELARKVGDSELERRLLIPYPELRAVLDVPA